MKKADMTMFINYLEYFKVLEWEKIEQITEDEFDILKNYYFKHEEGYDLEGDYNEFKEAVANKTKYEVSFDFLNEEGKWMHDTLNNNGKGFTLWDAHEVMEQLSADSICTKRNIEANAIGRR